MGAGPPGHGGHLQASYRAGRFHSWASWPEQVVGSKEEVQTYLCSGSPKLSSGTPVSFQESPVGRQGTWYFSNLV